MPNGNEGLSPTGEKVSPVIKKPETMDFSEAIKKVIEGKKITKLEWKDRNIYCLLEGAFLMIHKNDDRLYPWYVSEGDLVGKDWIAI